MELNESGSLRIPAALLESEPTAADSTNGIKMPGTDSGGGTHTEQGNSEPAAQQNGEETNKYERMSVVVVKSGRGDRQTEWRGDYGFGSDRNMRQFRIDFP